MRCLPEASRSNRWRVRCKGSPVMVLVFLRWEDLVMAYRGGRAQPMIFCSRELKEKYVPIPGVEPGPPG